MNPILSKEELEKLSGLKGNVRGMGMKNYAKFILEKEGKEGLKKLEEAMAQIGYPVKYEELKAMSLYPLRTETATLILIKRLFNYDDRKFQEMGRFGVKFSMLIKLFMKYFVSLEKLVKEAPKMWKKGGTLGDFRVAEYDLVKKQLTLRIENFNVHPLYCEIFKGYFAGAFQMIINKKIECKETECSFKGGRYHEFQLQWQ